MLVKYIKYPLLTKNDPTVMGIGYFDGVHLGHQELIKEVIKEARKLGVPASIFTFNTSIDKVLGKPFNGEITPLGARLKKFEEFGIEVVYVFEFEKEIASLNAEDFINKILLPLNVSKIVCGGDFRFGKNGSGDIKLLSKYMDVDLVDFFKVGDFKISSTYIIKLIKEGKVDQIPAYLGDYYSIVGPVVEGKGNGKKLGFPTANIDYADYVLPKNGVYHVQVIVEDTIYNGVCNIGKHPSIAKLDEESLEIHILDFQKDIYGMEISVKFLRFLREEQQFLSIENLKKQIKLDTFLNF